MPPPQKNYSWPMPPACSACHRHPANYGHLGGWLMLWHALTFQRWSKSAAVIDWYVDNLPRLTFCCLVIDLLLTCCWRVVDLLTCSWLIIIDLLTWKGARHENMKSINKRLVGCRQRCVHCDKDRTELAPTRLHIQKNWKNSGTSPKPWV